MNTPTIKANLTTNRWEVHYADSHVTISPLTVRSTPFDSVIEYFNNYFDGVEDFVIEQLQIS